MVGDLNEGEAGVWEAGGHGEVMLTLCLGFGLGPRARGMEEVNIGGGVGALLPGYMYLLGGPLLRV